MSRTDEVFKPALEGKEIPLLTLDNKWHRLFPKDKPLEVKKREEDLNYLLKRQGKLTAETKELKKLKKKLMNEIVGLADQLEQGDQKAAKTLENHKRLIDESNDQIEINQEELMDLRVMIYAVNVQLMLRTMETCYEQIQNDTAEIKEISKWIVHVRRELKKKLVRKREKEVAVNNLYQYMHQVFGAEVIEIFDLQYIPDQTKK